MIIDINPEFKKVIELFNVGEKFIHVHGKGGVGKSTLLNYIVEQNTSKRIAVLAPTGIAALNIGGQTIHSFFRFPSQLLTEDNVHLPNEETCKIIRAFDTIIIDEISMVRADLMDAIDYVLRRIKHNSKPFGGVQMMVFGDLYQLSPIVGKDSELFHELYETPYFFSANVMEKIKPKDVCLIKIYRQADTNFISILNNIRKNKCDQRDFDVLNSRVNVKSRVGSKPIILTARNDDAMYENVHKLGQINKPAFVSHAVVSGNFDIKCAPTDVILSLKEGAQVMFVKNDTTTQRWVNGTIGVVESCGPNGVRVNVDGYIYDVPQTEWEQRKYSLDSYGSVVSCPIGSFRQYPLKLAYAITIHKSQGQTFSDVVINFGDKGAFAYGQAYVAFSRCTSISGVVLKQKVQPRDIRVDPVIVEFMETIL